MGTTRSRRARTRSAALLNYGYTFYETTKVKSRGEAILQAARVQVRGRDSRRSASPQDIYVTVGRGEAANLKTTANVNEPLIAPLPANKPVGELTVTTAGGDVVARAPLVPAEGRAGRRPVDAHGRQRRRSGSE